VVVLAGLPAAVNVRAGDEREATNTVRPDEFWVIPSQPEARAAAREAITDISRGVHDVVTHGKCARPTVVLARPFDEEVSMRAALRNLVHAVRELTGSGASTNAHREVERAVRAVTDLEHQLRNLPDPTPRRAA